MDPIMKRIGIGGAAALILLWTVVGCGEPAAPPGQPLTDDGVPDVSEDIPDIIPPEEVIPPPDVETEVIDVEPDVKPPPDVEPDVKPPPDCEGEFKEGGCACTDSEECVSGYCLLSSQGKVCADYCIESCPEGWECLPVALPGAGADVQFLCVERSVYLCQPCESNNDCAALGFEGLDKCVDYGDAGSFCGIDCTESQCPEGYQCQEDQCVATSGECSCQPLHIQLEAQTSCQVTNAVGTCPGSRFCAEDGLTACDATAPQAEICDGLDNDCNGEVDELAGGECTITNQYGSCPGTSTCVGAAEICQGTPPSSDVCDGLDNDCDGETDKGYPDLDEDGLANCVDPDDDNDNWEDEMDNCPLAANTDQLDTDLDGQGDACDPDDDNDLSPDSLDCEPKLKNVYPNAPEICDGLDNNCNTAVDEKSCEDSDYCTDDICDPVQGCSNPFNDAPCNDSNPCTIDDKCVLGQCNGAFLSCDDNNTCTDDSCDQLVGCKHVPNTVLCTDGNFCTVGDSCAGGACLSGTMLDCNDGNPCTLDTCDPNGGCEITASSGPCDDSNACTAQDTCVAGGCSGSFITCDDGNPCTLDSCDAATGCVTENTPGGVCSDGNDCTEADQCVDGSCQGTDMGCECAVDADCIANEDDDLCNGTLVCDMDTVPSTCELDPETIVTCTLPEGVSPACASISCNPETGGCELTISDDGTACTDNNACTGATGDTCQVGICKGDVVVCDDDNLCTNDSCDSATGCVQTPVAGFKECDDDDPCTPWDGCEGGFCKGQGAVDCDDDNVCTTDSCKAGEGCVHSSAAGATCNDGNACTTDGTCSAQGQCTNTSIVDCDDNNACTTDSCDAVTGCQHAALSDTACDDGDACTATDLCAAGNCVGSGQPNCDDQNSCTTDSCNSQGGCANTPTVGSACDDGNACTTAGTCNASGQCANTQTVGCNDQNVCTTDSCDVNTGCVNDKLTGTACDDGNACTATDACATGTCTGTGLVECNDDNTCTVDSCNEQSGCINTVQVAADCNDNNACTATSACNAGGFCVGSDPVVCTDNDVCNGVETCDPAQGCVNGTALDCEDGQSCTVDQCDALAGCSSTPDDVLCDDDVECTIDTCDAATGCQFTASDSLCDDTLFCNGTETCDADLGCQDGTAPTTDDTVACTVDACDDDTDQVTHTPDHSVCSDGDACTLDVCDAAGCSNPAADPGAPCDDGDGCTVNESCLDGTCLGGQACSEVGKLCSNGECVGGGTATVTCVSTHTTVSDANGSLELLVSPTTAGSDLFVDLFEVFFSALLDDVSGGN